MLLIGEITPVLQEWRTIAIPETAEVLGLEFSYPQPIDSFYSNLLVRQVWQDSKNFHCDAIIVRKTEGVFVFKLLPTPSELVAAVRQLHIKKYYPGRWLNDPFLFQVKIFQL